METSQLDNGFKDQPLGENWMADTQTVKVYELAKELGIDSISLLDKLKGLNINVKNHMSDLAAEDVSMARTSLRRPAVRAADAEKKAAKPRTRKKPTAEAADGAAPAKAPAKTTATKTTKSARATSAAQVAAAESAALTKASSPIIRRRTK